MRKNYLLSRLSTTFVKKFLVPSLFLGVCTSVWADCAAYISEEYDFGVDFNPIDSAAESLDDVIIPEGIGLSLREGDVKSYRVGNNATEFFGQTPIIENLIGSGNYYMFSKDPNGSLFTIGFINSAVVRGKDYKFNMSMYIQPGKDCDVEEWKNAKLNAKTNMGNDLKQYVSIQAYGNDNFPFITPTQIYNGGTHLFEVGEGKGVSFTDFLNVDSIGPNDLIRLDIDFFGTFPNDTSLSTFEISPMFEQLSCANVAVDFIGRRDLETICIDDYIGDVGEETTAHAAGFPLYSKIEWLKQENDGSWVVVGNSKDLPITVEAGIRPYKLRVTIEKDQIVEIGFKVIGKEHADINEVDAVDADPIVNVYTVDGVVLKSNVKQSEALTGLKKGVYIVGDKKVYVSE